MALLLWRGKRMEDRGRERRRHGERENHGGQGREFGWGASGMEREMKGGIER